jgi:DNA-binding XRE family transcriptional regulator
MLPFCDRTAHVPRSKYLPSRNRGISIPKEPMTIGGHLRRRRLELGVLQAQVARKLGVSTVSLSKWECDKTFPTGSYRGRIIAFLGYDPFDGAAKSGRVTSNATNRHSLPFCDCA